MTAVDFEQWIAPDLVLTLGGNTYRVEPPSVADAGKILALAVLAEVKLGLAKGEIPPEVQAVVDAIQPDEHPALRDAFSQMKRDGLLPVSLDRASVYAIFFWARGKEYADAVATLLWTDLDTPEREAAAAPKG